jgi:aryl-alcohol dehydrogenase-like predicted oxidoreductase
MEILNNDSLIRKMHDFKDQGLVKAIGASTKTPEGGIKTLELMDVVMACYNPLYTDEKPILDYASRNNKGVLLKKALVSGHVNRLVEKTGDNPVEIAMDFAFSHPGTGGIIVGTINPAHLRENVETAQKILSRK